MGSRYDGKVLIFDSMESYHIPEDSLELNIGEEARDNYRTVQQLEVYQVSFKSSGRRVDCCFRVGLDGERHSWEAVDTRYRFYCCEHLRRIWEVFL